MDHDIEGVATVSVPKSKALRKSGPKKGRLHKGCRFAGRGIRCTPEAAARLGAGRGIKGHKRKGKGRRGGMPNIVPKSPQAAERMRVFQALMQARRNFSRTATTCEDKRWNGRKIIEALRYLARLPGKVSRKNPSGDTRARNLRYAKEAERVGHETVAFCSHPDQRRGRVSSDASYQAHMTRMRRQYGPSHISGVKKKR